MTLPRIDPTQLFNIEGKSAIIVGATGAFGQIASATLGAAGAKLTLTAGNAENLSDLQSNLKGHDIHATTLSKRPDTEADCDEIVQKAVDIFGGLDILVIASGINDVAPIHDLGHTTLSECHACQCHRRLVDGPRCRQADDGCRKRRQSCFHLIRTG